MPAHDNDSKIIFPDRGRYGFGKQSQTSDSTWIEDSPPSRYGASASLRQAAGKALCGVGTMRDTGHILHILEGRVRESSYGKILERAARIVIQLRRLWINGAFHLDTASSPRVDPRRSTTAPAVAPSAASPAMRDDTADSMAQAVCLLSEGGMLVYPKPLRWQPIGKSSGEGAWVCCERTRAL
jgi:hypothetical protein